MPCSRAMQHTDAVLDCLLSTHRMARAMKSKRTSSRAQHCTSKRSKTTRFSWNSQQQHNTNANHHQPSQPHHLPPQHPLHSLSRIPFPFSLSGCLWLASKRLQQTAPAGVYLLPSPQSFSLFHGLIFIRKGYYRRGIFAFTLTLPQTYPTVAPTIAFTAAEYDLFHPLIAPTGTVDTAHLDWASDTHTLTHILAYIKKLFYKVEWWADSADSAATVVGRRDTARELWKTNKEEFARRVALCVAASIDTLTETGRAMHVTRPTQQHERVWQRIAQQWAAEEEESAEMSAQPTRSYLQWFIPGSECLVSREDAMGDGLGRAKIAVTADEEKEWMEQERRRRADERKQRVDTAAGKDEGEQQDTPAEVEAEQDVHTAQYALDESVTPEEEELP